MKKEDFVLLFKRDIRKLQAEIEKYDGDDSLWLVLPGTINSGGNLCQHLIGNIRTYIGLTLGSFPYTRDRDAEFGKRLFTQSQLLTELALLLDITEKSINKLTEEDLSLEYPREIFDMFPEHTVSLVLTHLLAHLSYHTGQINYHRRWITAGQ